MDLINNNCIYGRIKVESNHLNQSSDNYLTMTGSNREWELNPVTLSAPADVSANGAMFDEISRMASRRTQNEQVAGTNGIGMLRGTEKKLEEGKAKDTMSGEIHDDGE